MSGEIYRLVTAATHFVPALLWGVIAHDVATYLRRRRPRGTFPRVLFGLTFCTALHYATWTSVALLRGHLQGRSGLRGMLMALTDGSVILIIALARHVGVLWPIHNAPPTHRWLAVNYGLCAVMLAAAVLSDLFILEVPGWQAYVVYSTYLLILGAAVVWDFRSAAERGSWRPGVLWQARTADVIAIGIALVLIAVEQAIPAVLHTTSLALLLSPQPSAASLAMYTLNGTAALVFAVPFVVRNLGDLLPAVLTGLVATAVVVVVVVGAGAIASTSGDAEIKTWTMAVAIAVVVFVVMPVRAWLQPTLGRLLFRRGHLRWAELHHVIQGLQPEVGVGDCCQRLLGDLVRIMQLRGAAILLYDGTAVRAGRIDVEEIRRVWPRDGAALPAGTLDQSIFRELPRPLADALAAADVLAAVPIASPRRLWGHAFLTTDLRGSSFSDEDDAAVGATADQLALVLDAAALLERAVTVERALAHAEKLAAIGELAARFAHDIRNPITAARSLAQQLARDPTAPENTEHAGIILEELERVERQVRDLLRFARREELRLEPVDLGELVRVVTRDLAGRLRDARIVVDLDTADGIVARADREKLRQVMINLVENAVDALATSAGARRLEIAVSAANGDARLSVADSGPGVPPEALPRLFEPFFSLKPSGTGLGLAIAKRIVEAHGGRIGAASTAGEGTRVDIALPLGSGV